MPHVVSQHVLCIGVIYVVATLIYRLRFVNHRPIWEDGFTYMRVARQMAQQKRFPKELDFYRVESNNGDAFTLPPLLMILLVPLHRLPYRAVVNLPYLVDLLIAWLVFAASRHICGATELQAFGAAIMYLLSPINAFLATALTPRQLGLLFFFLLNTCFSIYISTGSLTLLAMCPLWVALLLLSQRMITQILLIGAPFVCIALSTSSLQLALLFLSCLLLGVAIAILISKGHYQVIIKDHYARVLSHFHHGDQTTFTKKVGSPLSVLKANPWMVIALVVALVTQDFNPSLTTFYYYGLTTIFLAFLWVFGNSVNHMFFLAPVFAVTSSKYLFLTDSSALIYLVTASLCTILIIREYNKIRRRYIGKEWFDCFDFINEHGLTGNVLFLPGISCPPLVYYTNLNLLSAGHGSKAMEYNRLFLRKNASNMDFLTNFLSKQDVSFVLLEKHNANSAAELRIRDPLVTLFENDKLCFFAVPTAPSFKETSV